MKIALARVSSYQNWYKEASIGLGYVAAVLEKKGLEVGIFDGRYFNVKDEILAEKIKIFSPDIIGFTSMTHEIKRVAAICGELKRSLRVPIIIGGCHVTALPVQTMEDIPFIDYGIIGEGEGSVLDLVEHLKGRMKIADVGGIVHKDNGKIVQNKPRGQAVDLDALPFPAFHHYFKNGKKSLCRRDRYYQIFSSRGCIFKCAFCMRTLGETLRRRSAKNIIEEIDFAQAAYGAHTIDFRDELFLSNDEKTKEILHGFIEAGLPKKIRWAGTTRASFIDKKIIKIAKESGCYELGLGVESGNDDMLKKVNKSLTVSQVRFAVGVIKKEKIRINTYYIIGHPGENDGTIRDTIDLAVELNTDQVAIGLMVPYPGTKVYEWAQEGRYGYKLLTADWERYDKYGTPVLEIDGLPAKRLEGFQYKAYILFYLKNFRIFSLLRFIILKHRGIFTVLKKQFINK